MVNSPVGFVLALLFFHAQVQLAYSGIVLAIEESVVPFSTIDQAGFAEIFVRSDDVSLPDISAHQMRLKMDMSSGITIQSISTPSNHTYLGPNSAPSASISAGQQVVDVGDIDFTGATALFDGAGLARLEYKVPAGTPVGSYTLLFDESASRTFLADASNSKIAISFNPGTITVVPEPRLIPGLAAILLTLKMVSARILRR